MTSMLPNRYAYQFAKIEPYGFFIVLALLYFNILNYWFMPMMTATNWLLKLLASPLTLLLS